MPERCSPWACFHDGAPPRAGGRGGDRAQGQGPRVVAPTQGRAGVPVGVSRREGGTRRRGARGAGAGAAGGAGSPRLHRRGVRARRAHLPRSAGRAGPLSLRAARGRGAAAARLRADQMGVTARSPGLAVLRGGRSAPHAAGRRRARVITASFRHIGGIGPLRERQLWFSGVRSWAEVPGEGDILSPRLDGKLREGVAASLRKLAECDLEFFGQALPQTEHWRLLPQVIEEAAFLDIEAAADKVTVAGVLDADGLASFRGDLSGLLERSRRWRALVTFNGTVFDVPILRRVLPEWKPPAVHVDLRHVYQRLRDKGGLKDIEVRVGFFRPPHLTALCGADAVALWHAQTQGDPAALRRLVEYNLYDVFHLRPLAELGYNRLIQRV